MRLTPTQNRKYNDTRYAKKRLTKIQQLCQEEKLDVVSFPHSGTKLLYAGETHIGTIRLESGEWILYVRTRAHLNGDERRVTSSNHWPDLLATLVGE